MVRILLGALLTGLFVAGLAETPNLLGYVLVGGLVFLLPAGLLVWSGWRSRTQVPGGDPERPASTSIHVTPVTVVLVVVSAGALVGLRFLAVATLPPAAPLLNTPNKALPNDPKRQGPDPDRQRLWNRVSAQPPGEALFSYYLQYPSDARSDMASAAISCFTWHPLVPLFGNTPKQREYIEALRSSDPVRRAEYAGFVREHGKKAILFVPHLIPLLEDGTALSILSGAPIGPKTNVGTTTVRDRARWALTGITSEDFGYDTQRWSDWWRTWWNTQRGEFY